jgi:hypothetical protein
MQTKLLPFSTRDFKKAKDAALTPKMIYALLIAIQKQERKVPLDPDSINGPLAPLIDRGLIVKKRIPVMGRMQHQWQVTKAAIIKLNKLGYQC